ncbi:MAG: aromatic ring-hydroxylating dioxygenase subunit alpha [Gammaproteobacteria bacterium]|nr:aromatic ring-hydroxylating dioxygenase subunit alpha [Gammaproteobacteria bacterium]MCP4089481.1 aromatic ring-hydroxylating dioxygenase subunit alpha [Gammaproteobacteria bacterium]MCP4276187.1 aromatic ring-hydroxylating dioxygenase subunit alpha [Gammaproteobacteria bacterium]MCP4832884.1 aromatic ring-hydroxylating dioxygenase subunit alpha [Gammaproteobacteria bacterium]MCP4930009.1 aromatic ring-hydroxylating dioxygenase subunit alpha [Gammaproteobacteria bacterium]
MYINFWYPMATSEELTDKPLKVRGLGQDFVVFRGEDGKAKCLSNTCTHRGGSLAGGKISGDCIQCPYHGWEFDEEGFVKRLPSLGPNPKVPARTRIDAYPVDERHGIVFAFLGDLPEEERPPIIDVPEWGQEGWKSTLQSYTLKGNYERSIENGIDPAHNEFVHDTHGFSGEDEEYHVGEMRMDKVTQWGQGFWHTFKAPPLPKDADFKGAREGAGDLEAGTGYHGPSQVWTYIHLTDDNYMHQYLIERPIDEENIAVYLLCMRNCYTDDKFDENVMDRNLYVAKQDIVIVEDLHPVITPDTNTKEFMVPSDKCILMYRESLKEWSNKGWKIDAKTVAATEKRVAYAIPSPARHEQKGWVLDSIPLLSAEKDSSKLKATG